MKDSTIIPGNFTTAYPQRKFPCKPGQVAEDASGNQYIFLVAAAAIPINNVAYYNLTANTVDLTQRIYAVAGIAQATLANTEGGWFLVWSTEAKSVTNDSAIKGSIGDIVHANADTTGMAAVQSAAKQFKSSTLPIGTCLIGYLAANMVSAGPALLSVCVRIRKFF